MKDEIKFKVDGLTFLVLDQEAHTVALTKGAKYKGHIVVPCHVAFENQEWTVTQIGKRAFKKCTALTQVTLPDTITRIGGEAFYGCTGLASITLPPSVAEVGIRAFSECTALTSFTLPPAVTEIEDEVFKECTNLTSVLFEGPLTYISAGAFCKCSALKSITLPATMKDTFLCPFGWCDSLLTVISLAPEPFQDCLPFDKTTWNYGTLYVPDEGFEAYKKKWTDFYKIKPLSELGREG